MKKDEIIPGHWQNITRPAETYIIQAQYDRIKDWVMDPRGYFLIRVEPAAGLIRTAFCSPDDHVIQAEITGQTALDIVNTLIREEFVSTLQHAADLGSELQKAELALRHGLEYVQDDELKLDGSAAG